MPDYGLPDVRVKVDGSEPPPEIQSAIIRATVRSHLDRSDTFLLELDSGDELLVDLDHFPLGSRIEISLGQADDLQPVFEGDITGWYSDFVEGKGMRFTVRGSDRSHLLHRAVRNRAFTHDNDADVVKQIAQEHGLTAEVEVSPRFGDVRIQMNQTDHAFVRDRARRLGWIYRVVGSTLHFKPPVFEDSGRAYSTATEIASWDIFLDLTPVATQVEVHGWDWMKKQAILGVAKAGKEWWAPTASKAGHKLAKDFFGEAVSKLGDMTLITKDEADEIAKGYFERLTQRTVTGPMTVTGDPLLKVGTTYQVSGLGKAMDGSWLAGEVVHLFTRDGGYVTRILATRNAVEL